MHTRGRSSQDVRSNHKAHKEHKEPTSVLNDASRRPFAFFSIFVALVPFVVHFVFRRSTKSALPTCGRFCYKVADTTGVPAFQASGQIGRFGPKIQKI